MLFSWSSRLDATNGNNFFNTPESVTFNAKNWLCLFITFPRPHIPVYVSHVPMSQSPHPCPTLGHSCLFRRAWLFRDRCQKHKVHAVLSTVVVTLSLSPWLYMLLKECKMVLHESIEIEMFLLSPNLWQRPPFCFATLSGLSCQSI